MLELYNDDFSTCAQKVRLVLAEKGLQWETHTVNLAAGEQHKPEYAKLNPNKVVPTLVHDGQVLIESSRIIEYLDRVYESCSLTPADSYDYYTMQSWSMLVDTKVHTLVGLFTVGIGARQALLQRSPEEREAMYASIQNPALREKRRSVIEEGFDSPWLHEAVSDCVTLLDKMEGALADSPWLAGDSFSLADIGLSVYANRLDELAFTPLFSNGQRQNLADWLERVRARASWQEQVTQKVPEQRAQMMRMAGEKAWPQIDAIIAAA